MSVVRGGRCLSGAWSPGLPVTGGVVAEGLYQESHGRLFALVEQHAAPYHLWILLPKTAWGEGGAAPLVVLRHLAFLWGSVVVGD